MFKTVRFIGTVQTLSQVRPDSPLAAEQRGRALEVIDSQLHYYRAMWEQRNAKEYHKWLTQGYTAGMRSLFRNLSKRNARPVRPHQDLPFEQASLK